MSLVARACFYVSQWPQLCEEARYIWQFLSMMSNLKGISSKHSAGHKDNVDNDLSNIAEFTQEMQLKVF